VAYRIYRFSHQFTVDDACSLLVQHSNGVYTVGDFMTGRDNLHVVQPSTPVDQALELLVQHKISGLPVVDDDGKLVGVVSDYDLLALDSISGIYFFLELGFCCLQTTHHIRLYVVHNHT